MGKTLLITFLLVSLLGTGWAAINAVDLAYQIAMIMFFAGASLWLLWLVAPSDRTVSTNISRRYTVIRCDVIGLFSIPIT